MSQDGLLAQTVKAGYQIQGEVRDKVKNQSLSNVQVFLNQTAYNTETYENGIFVIDSIGTGTYTLVAKKPGYHIISTKITLPEFTSKKILLGLNPLNPISSTKSETEKTVQLIDSLETRATTGTDINPNIGFRYIEKITELKLEDRYSNASEIYLLGLSSRNDPAFKEDFAKEIERLEPIVTEKTLGRWNNLLGKGHLQKLGRSIKTFWKLGDPIPSTPINERLIEHWERLAYAKKHFTKSSSWIYGTDDRARIYVKFGKPDNAGTVNPQASGSQTSDFNDQTDASSAVKNIATGYFSNLGEGGANTEIRNRITYYNKYPDMHIWIYHKSTLDTKEDIIFLFGNDGNTGEYRQLQAVEDLIPSKAFRSDPFSDIPVSLPMQMAYYGSLSKYHSLFDRIYFDINRMLDNARNTSTSLVSMTRHIRTGNRFTFSKLSHLAPEDRSMYESGAFYIPLKAYQYRILTKNNALSIVTLIESKPHKRQLIDQINQSVYNFSYQMLYNVSVGMLDSLVFEDSRVKHLSSAVEDFNEMKSSVAYFEIPHISAGSEQVFTTELHTKAQSANTLSASLPSEYIRGLGRYLVRQPEPLSTDPEKLEVGDLVIGYNKGTYNDISPFGFYITPEGRIPKGESIMIHFEVYHFKKPANSQGRFKIEYLLEPKTGLVQRLLGDGDPNQVRLTLNFESSQPAYRDNLEISTSELEPGEYTLTFKVIEATTGRQKTRQSTIRIIE